MRKVGIISLGCVKNLVDAELMLGDLASHELTITPDPEEADIIIVNTCGFIESAQQESVDTILQRAEYKNSNCKYCKRNRSSQIRISQRRKRILQSAGQNQAFQGQQQIQRRRICRS